MSLSESVAAILELDMPAAFERFGDKLDAEWVNEALEKTGTASVRRRKLPGSLVVCLVIGMSLFRDRSIQEVVGHLGLVLLRLRPTDQHFGPIISARPQYFPHTCILLASLPLIWLPSYPTTRQLR